MTEEIKTEYMNRLKTIHKYDEPNSENEWNQSQPRSN